MKRLTIWIVLGVISFLLLVGVIFTLLIYIDPIDEQMTVKAADGDKTLASEIIQQKQKEIERLSNELDSLRLAYQKALEVRDSVSEQLAFKDGLIAEYRKTAEALNSEISRKERAQSSIKELAKTYESMKVAEMAPILQNLDDKTVLLLYEHINPRNRKNLLMALNASRAALITQKITNLSAAGRNKL